MKTRNDQPVLVADIGGTNCRLALARNKGPRPQLEQLRVLPTPRGNLDETLRAYLREAQIEQPAGIAVAAAGRVHRSQDRSWITLTNAALHIEREALAAMAGGRGWLLNDLAAVAAALPLFDVADLELFGPSRTATPGVRLVVGVGTGFGAAALSLGSETLDAEAGHADLAAVTPDEHEWLLRLSPQARVSVEDVLSGPGLLRLYESRSQQRCEHVATLIERWRAQEPAAVETLTMFSTWLGRSVGNLVLALGAWGGVYLIGGVVSGLGAALDAAAFRRGFEDKAPFGPDLAAVPVHHIVHPQPAMLGLAALALSR